MSQGLFPMPIVTPRYLYFSWHSSSPIVVPPWEVSVKGAFWMSCLLRSLFQDHWVQTGIDIAWLIILLSSTNRRALIFWPHISTPPGDCSIRRPMSLMKSAHTRGDRGHPCLTPLLMKTSLRPIHWPLLLHRCVCLYRYFSKLMDLGWKPILVRFSHNRSWGTLSNAFDRSRKRSDMSLCDVFPYPKFFSRMVRKVCDPSLFLMELIAP